MSRYSDARTNALIGSGVSAQDFKAKIADYRAAVSAENKSRIVSDLHAMLAGCGIAADGCENIDELEKLAQAVYPEIPADGRAAAAGLWQKLCHASGRYPSPGDFIAKLTDECACPFYKFEDSLRLRLLKQILATVNIGCKSSPFLSERFSPAYGDRDPAKIALLDESVFSALETELTEAEDLRLLAENHTFLPPMNADGKALLSSVFKNAAPALAEECLAFSGPAAEFVKRVPDKVLSAPTVWQGEKTTVAAAIRIFIQKECDALTDSFAVRKELAKAMAAAEKENVPDFAERFSRYIESVSAYLLDPALRPEIETAISAHIDVPEGVNVFEHIGNIIAGDPKFNAVLNTLVSEFYNVNGLEESYSAATGKGSFSRQKIIAEALKHENAELTEGAAAKIRDAGYAGIIKESGEIDYVFLDKAARACDAGIKTAQEKFKAALNDVVNKAEEQRRLLQQAADLYRAAKARMEREKRDPTTGLADWVKFANRLADPSAAWNTITRDELFALAFAFNLRFCPEVNTPDYDHRRDVEEALYLRYYTGNVADLTERAPVKRSPDYRDRSTAIYLYFLAAGGDDMFGEDAFRASGDRFVRAAEMNADLDSRGAGSYVQDMSRQAFADMITDGYGGLIDAYTFAGAIKERYTLEQKPSNTPEEDEIGKNEAALRRIFCRRFAPYAGKVRLDLNRTSILSDVAAASGMSEGSEFVRAVKAIASGLFGSRRPDPDKLTRADVVSVYFSAFAVRTRYPKGVSFADLCEKDFAPGLNTILSGCGFGLFSPGRFADAVTSALVFVYMNSLFGDAPARKEQERRSTVSAPAQKSAPVKKAAPVKAEIPAEIRSAPAEADKPAEPAAVKEEPAETPEPVKTVPEKAELPIKTAVPEKARPTTEAELLKNAKFGVKIIPAAKRQEEPEKPAVPATVKDEPDKPAEAAKAKPDMKAKPEAELLKTVKFGAKIVPGANQAAAKEIKAEAPVRTEDKPAPEKKEVSPEKPAFANKAEKASDKPKEKATAKPAEKQTPVKTAEKAPDKPKEKATAKPAEKQTPVKTAEKTSEKPMDKAAAKPADKQTPVKTTEKTSDKPKAKATEKPAEKKTPVKTAEKAPDKPKEKAAAKPAEKPAPAKKAEKAPDKPKEKAAAKPAEKPAPAKTTEKTSDKPKAKSTTKPSEKPAPAKTTGKTSDKPKAEATTKPSEKPASAKTTEKTSEKPKAKAITKPAQKAAPAETTEKITDKKKAKTTTKAPAGKAGAKAEPPKKQSEPKKPAE
ncbi:MAG: hypothetical protein K6G90_08405 [Clostridia bacterium]|nr:hypothetical protein [Clostridia bacterium]